MMPLNLASTGEIYSVKRIGGKPEVRQHLEEMGFTEGTEINVISSVNGCVIVKVRESRVAINQQMASKIMI
ncbi:MAG: ferrous iron transport protein A [Erysipelotrichaceae bacterium]|nr:ferrous iron transport protein A [Erysipelotrichaceae bacterium]MBQ4253749.1 ferrous iron transport protein A [Erysipelotrichaceae bacterium]